MFASNLMDLVSAGAIIENWKEKGVTR